MTWLVTGDRVLASLEVADSPAMRVRGLLGRDELDGALLLEPARAVHTVGLKFAIDVAYCDGELIILDVVTMVPRRVGLPRWRARRVVEAPAGSFERWGIGPGDQLEIKLAE